MSYIKQNFVDGNPLYADELNHIEDGIKALENELNNMSPEDGYSPTVTVSKSGKVTTIKITDINGTKTATINDGADGSKGADGKTPVKGVDYFDGKDGVDGKDGQNGKDGVSATHSWNGTTLTVTSASGTSSANLKGEKGDTGSNGTSVTVSNVTTSTADGGSNVVTFSDGKTLTVKNGSKGSTGSAGKDGTNGNDGVGIKSVVQTTTSSADGGSNVITVTKTDGTTSTFTVKNGSKGSTGSKGADGKTPVKGTDYFTEADKAEMVEDVKNSIDGLDELLGAGTEEVTYTPNLAGYMYVSTGAINTADQTYHTDYIALDGYKRIYAEYKLSSNGYALAFFDTSKNLITGISIIGAGASAINTIDMDVPSEAKYCMLSCYEYSGTPKSFIKLTPTRGVLERLDNLEADTTKILNGKTIAVLGDSISSVAYTTPNYWQLIAEKTGCDFLDYGVSGSCFAVRSGSTTSFVERAANMESADAVLVMGGTNDAGKDILLGEWASTDTTTLYGALNTLISLLRTKYYGKPIIFCTPIKSMYEKDSGFPNTMADLKTAPASTNVELWHSALAIQAKCAVHGIPVIDLYNASGIGSQSSVFFREDDKLHPSDIGECRIANMVQPILEQQFLYTAEYPTHTYTNLVPKSTDTDGSIYNGTGYKDDTRLSSSGGVSGSAQAGSATTGFMPWEYPKQIRIKGAAWLGTNGHYYINFYKSDKTFVNYISREMVEGNNAGGCVVTYDATTDITTFDFSNATNSWWNNVAANSAFIRLNAYGKGADLIVTVNQEITD